MGPALDSGRDPPSGLRRPRRRAPEEKSLTDFHAEVPIPADASRDAKVEIIASVYGAALSHAAQDGDIRLRMLLGDGANHAYPVVAHDD